MGIAQVQNVQKINAVSTGKVANEKSMMVWRPHGNKMFETFSFLPPLSDADLTKQVQYLLNNADEVIQEVKACVKAFPNCYVRCAGFDNIKQVQCAGFLCYRPKLDPMEGGARQVGDRQV